VCQPLPTSHADANQLCDSLRFSLGLESGMPKDAPSQHAERFSAGQTNHDTSRAKMKIIDHEPQTWFLAEESGNLYLDVSCSQGAVGYSFAIELSAQELAEYKDQGRCYLNWLAEDIHNSVPGMINSGSKYKDRRIAREFSERLDDAILNRQNN